MKGESAPPDDRRGAASIELTSASTPRRSRIALRAARSASSARRRASSVRS